MTEQVCVGDRIAAHTDTLAYLAGDKFGRIERIEGNIYFVRMERSCRLTPFRRDQFMVARERAG